MVSAHNAVAGLHFQGMQHAIGIQKDNARHAGRQQWPCSVTVQSAARRGDCRSIGPRAVLQQHLTHTNSFDLRFVSVESYKEQGMHVMKRPESPKHTAGEWLCKCAAAAFVPPCIPKHSCGARPRPLPGLGPQHHRRPAAEMRRRASAVACASAGPHLAEASSHTLCTHHKHIMPHLSRCKPQSCTLL